MKIRYNLKFHNKMCAQELVSEIHFLHHSVNNDIEVLFASNGFVLHSKKCEERNPKPEKPEPKSEPDDEDGLM